MIFIVSGFNQLYTKFKGGLSQLEQMDPIYSRKSKVLMRLITGQYKDEELINDLVLLQPW